MAHSCDAIARYDRLLQDARYLDLFWAEAFQERMRERMLASSGRVISSTLRPAFLDSTQLTALACAAERLARIIVQVRSRIAETPRLLNRLQLLPAEKALAVLHPISSCFGALFTFGFHLARDHVFLDSVNCPDVIGLAQSWVLDGLFRELAIVKQFNCETQPEPATAPAEIDDVRSSLFNLNGHLAVVHNAAHGSDLAAAKLVSELVSAPNQQVRLVAASDLESSDNRRLRFQNVEIGTVLRLVDAKELIIRAGLAHPLLQAYRDGTVCLVNDFRSEIVQRRAFFELLSDPAVLSTVPQPDREFLDQAVPWTRVFVQRKTSYCGQPVDLVPFASAHRDNLRLCPNDSVSNQPTYVGAEASQQDWSSAIKEALKGSYVVQRHPPSETRSFPFFRYGQLDWAPVRACPQIHVVGGRAVFQSAKLQSCSRGVAHSHGMTPVFAC